MEKGEEKVSCKNTLNNLISLLKNKVIIIVVMVFLRGVTVFQKLIMMQHLCI